MRVICNILWEDSASSLLCAPVNVRHCREEIFLDKEELFQDSRFRPFHVIINHYFVLKLRDQE